MLRVLEVRMDEFGLPTTTTTTGISIIENISVVQNIYCLNPCVLLAVVARCFR
jgi:hypothetical protein